MKILTYEGCVDCVMCRLLAEHEGIEPLVMLLGDSNSQCRLYASQCITEMSSHGNHSVHYSWQHYKSCTEFLRVQLITNSAVVEKLSSSLTFKWVVTCKHCQLLTTVTCIVSRQYNWPACRHWLYCALIMRLGCRLAASIHSIRAAVWYDAW